MAERDLPKVEIGVRFPLLAHVKYPKTYQEFQARVRRAFLDNARRAEFPRYDRSCDSGHDRRRVAAVEVLALGRAGYRERCDALR